MKPSDLLAWDLLDDISVSTVLLGHINVQIHVDEELNRCRLLLQLDRFIILVEVRMHSIRIVVHHGTRTDSLLLTIFVVVER